MSQLTISEVARRVGLRPSAIRYYERIGMIPAAQRISGQRRFDARTLHRLSIVQRARQLGFTLEEIRRLCAGSDAQAAKRWQQASQRKIAGLEAALARIRTMTNCRCEALDECGARILRQRC
jgi:MerR family redox-sensitive transcriptional activator SoxR